MNDELFAELLGSVREGGAILRGEQEPARTAEINVPDVKRLRSQFGLSQDQFAHALGVGVGTLRNWEQGRRRPTGAARVLLFLVQARPDVLAFMKQSTLPERDAR